jgi:ribose transport system ATP-binding protein
MKKEKDEILRVEGLSKSFGAVNALKDVSILFHAGEVHALVGENGAGKSTLSKIISGVYEQSRGEIHFNGELIHKADPRRMQHLGIYMIPQDLGLLKHLSVMENIFLGSEQARGGILLRKRSLEECNRIIEALHLSLDPHHEVGELTLEQQQFVALARVLSKRSELIIMDEPTAALSETGVENLFKIIGRMKASGKTVIYISHKLDEIFRIADRVSVLKDGMLVRTTATSDTDKNEIITSMVGRSLSKAFPPKSAAGGRKVVITLEGVSVPGALHGIDLEVRAGEILGIGGLSGSGQNELVNVIFGSREGAAGEIRLDGSPLHGHSPGEAIRKGIYYISSDRPGEMLFMCRSVRENITIGTLRDCSKAGIIRKPLENVRVDDRIRAYSISVPTPATEVQFLSGGNQQKVALSRWSLHKPRVLVVNEPTQGIDVGTKEEIYLSLRSLADEGIAIVAVFSDMIELLGMCDRIAVMYEGRIVKVFEGTNVTEEEIMAAASNE